MVTSNLTEKILKSVKDTKTICDEINHLTNEISIKTEKLLKDIIDIGYKQDYLITNLRESCYSPIRDYFNQDNGYK